MAQHPRQDLAVMPHNKPANRLVGSGGSRSQSLDLLERDCVDKQQSPSSSNNNHHHPMHNKNHNKFESHSQSRHQRNNKIRHESLENSDKKQQDGKRTLIKNQLHLIEQLQLENANLRNERDQLQLENEELKFQLQMIR